ncbi:conserved hypothetical protein [Cryptococcus deneoformans JEC21]|uniref:Elongator complex protein 2 n=1 Tax=Cryptococcus deneoformans (strain JEC21 / ATCC MYA-565) TaxID=214684 RepID=Q5KLS1_CRYD1|nr:conserved hypothetical protein [Cryptococcus neoformans var. neoformans JEC21]AAW41943.2 conserved hypothetical protein [Cryptococcus neoformans var. neoformans JEC21]
MRITPEYISVGANRSSSCAACSASGLLFFGAGNFIALWDSSSNRGVHATLPGHKGQVTTVKLLPDGRLVSGDNIGEIRVWNSVKGDDEWECVMSWEAHRGGSISAIGVLASRGSLDDMIITGGSDSLIKRWKIADKPEEIQKIDLGGKLPLDLEVGYLPGSEAPILALGCTDRRIQIWTIRDGSFTRALSLEGHEDWVRCLSFTPYPSASSSSQDLLLASGSQDNFIRLWRVSPIEQEVASPSAGDEGLEMLDEFEKRLAGEAGGNVQISTKAHILGVQDGEKNLRFNITLEALLVGHESGLTNVHWSPTPTSSSPTPLLLSTASDNSLIIWSPSSTSTSADGIWVPTNRFGAIGGRGLSFYGAIWGKDGKSVMAGGWNGGWEKWVESEQGWDVQRGLTGHHGSVETVCWDPRGEYLLSVASDQTARIHAECNLPSSSTSIWAEIARPQIHGYDMTDASFISPLRFVSGADEKVARVFDAPQGFVESLRSLGISKREAEEESRPKGATVPPLGLSNRALQKAPVAGDAVEKQGQNEAIISISHTFTSLPTEEELATSTLWPEVEKVYGHGYELVCAAASHAGDLIATASKATNAEHAVIRVISASKWELVGEPLAGHSLTITSVSFSRDDKRILSCSRDRGWRVFERKEDGEGYFPLAGDEKAHARMVLDACWADERNDMFATASRDKTVKIWTSAVADGSQWAAAGTIKLTVASTAVAMINDGSDGYLLAVGKESGSIEVFTVAVNRDGVKSDLLSTFDRRVSHVSAVNKLAWRNVEGVLSLASCSDDRSVRVYKVEL